MAPHVPHNDDGGQDHGEEEEGHSNEAMWKGMVVLSGIYIFFIAERLMTMLTQWKRNATKKVRGN